MGRELKRVPLDFDWPLREIWAGYQNPFYTATKCRHCDGTGYSSEAKQLRDQWFGYTEFRPSMTGSTPFAIDNPVIRQLAQRNVSGGSDYATTEIAILQECRRLCNLFNHMWEHHLDQDDVNALWAEERLFDLNPNWHENHNEGVPAPSAATVNEWSLMGLGHDGFNQMIAVQAKCKRLGYPLYCEHCEGDGELWPSRAAKNLYETWENIEPPSGEGYQVWETVSEGSPISPVFATEDALIAWLLDQGYSEGAAEQFAKGGYAPSFVMTSKGLYNNIEGLNAI